MRKTLVLGGMMMTLAGCGGGGGESGGSAGGGGGSAEESDTMNFKLDEMNSSGTTANVEMFPGAASTEFTIELKPPKGDNQPIHVHKGTCDSPSSEVAHDVGFTTAGLGQGSAYVLIDDVATGEYVLDIHNPAGTKVISCGVIPKQ
ncbi:MAG TPA: hypothetical protein VNB86_12430 [Gaiellaceae bacterium]|nr:hypothetical protein [Gaiellaceae bacterium]